MSTLLFILAGLAGVALVAIGDAGPPVVTTAQGNFRKVANARDNGDGTQTVELWEKAGDPERYYTPTLETLGQAQPVFVPVMK